MSNCYRRRSLDSAEGDLTMDWEAAASGDVMPVETVARDEVCGFRRGTETHVEEGVRNDRGRGDRVRRIGESEGVSGKGRRLKGKLEGEVASLATTFFVSTSDWYRIEIAATNEKGRSFVQLQVTPRLRRADLLRFGSRARNLLRPPPGI